MRSLIVLLALALAAACSSQPQSRSPRPVALHTVEGGTAQTREFSGIIASPVSSDLAFQVGGRITHRLVDPGDKVRRGQALFRIDPADIALAQSAASADAAAARSAAVRAASDFKRLEGLVEAGSISQAEYDAARAARDATASSLRAAEARASEVRRQRGYTTLVAPQSGTVTEVFAQPGQVVSPGAPVLHLAQAGPRDAIITIPEDALANLPRSVSARPLGSARALAASLEEVAGAADPVTRTYRVRYRLNGGAQLPLGSTVTITMELGGGEGQFKIPLGALHDPGDGPGVWVIGKDSRARWQQVRLVELRDEEAIVAGSLAPGTRIVALGAHVVVAGEAVREAQIGLRSARSAKTGSPR
ncbi:MAG: efflux RND transporter periplasmic adaptor subunit [Erythrobacter sp.]|nr:efflux RND transporter periplasmic adaptor subunit [Erythrobacter sp.]